MKKETKETIKFLIQLVILTIAALAYNYIIK